MKRIMYLCMAGLLGFAGLKAVDLQTNEAYKPLKIALELAQPLATMQDTWNALVTTHALAQPAITDLASQALVYAREQKTTREQELAALGNATYNSSLRTKGIAYTAFGLWCIASMGRFIHCMTSSITTINNLKFASNFLGKYSIDKKVFYPISFTIENINNTDLFVISILAGLAIDFTAPYFLYKGYRTIRDAYTHKQTLQTQIEHLTAAIHFFELQISAEFI